MENLTRGRIYLINVGKEKSYIYIFNYEEEGRSNNGKIQWKIPRIQQKSAYNWSLMENVLTGGFNTFDRSDQTEKRKKTKTRKNGCDQKLQISCTNSIKAKIRWLSERFSNHHCLRWSLNSISIISIMYMYNTTKCPQGFHRLKAKNLWDDWNSAFQTHLQTFLIQSTWCWYLEISWHLLLHFCFDTESVSYS